MKQMKHISKEFKTTFYTGVSDKIKVKFDGTEIYYDDELVNQYLCGSGKGFYQCCIENQKIYTHRLVALAFIENKLPSLYKFVIHKNSDTKDNVYTNLMWGNSKTLAKNNVKNGIVGKVNPVNRGSSNIGLAEAFKIANRLDNGEYASSIAKEYNVSEMSIARIRQRYCKQKKVAKDYSDIKSLAMIDLKDMTASEVAKKYNISYNLAFQWNKRVKELKNI